MKKEFLLHKDKENGNPPHIQAHLAALPHRRPLRIQKSLHFANPQLTVENSYTFYNEF